MHQDSNGVSRLVLYSEASGAGSASYGNGAVVNKPPFVTRTVSRGLTVKASSYGNVAISPPAVAGYTFLGVTGVGHNSSSRLNLFGFSSSSIGFHNWTSGDLTATITITLLYGRTGS